MTIIAGIDLSYTSPGICVFNSESPNETAEFFGFYSKKKYAMALDHIRIDLIPPYGCPEERYLQITEWAMAIIKANGVEFVSLEGYSMGSNSGLLFNIAENGSVLKQALYKAGIPFITPAPTSVKKDFAGKGNATKEVMAEEFQKRFGWDMHEAIGGIKGKSPAADLIDAFANGMMYFVRDEWENKK